MDRLTFCVLYLIVCIGGAAFFSLFMHRFNKRQWFLSGLSFMNLMGMVALLVYLISDLHKG
jgi:DMSO reductase anchor subunit